MSSPGMAAPREFRLAIIGKGTLRKIAMGTVDFADFFDSLEQKFFFAPGEMDRLELRRVDEEPAVHTASHLFEVAAERPIRSSPELQAVDVQYIVGKIAEPAGACLRRCTG